MTRPTPIPGRSLAAVAALTALAAVSPVGPASASAGQRSATASYGAASARTTAKHQRLSPHQRRLRARARRMLNETEPYVDATGEVIHVRTVWRNFSPGPGGRLANVQTVEGWYEVGGGKRQRTFTTSSDPVTGQPVPGHIQSWSTPRLTVFESPDLRPVAIVACREDWLKLPDFLTPKSPAELAALPEGPVIAGAATRVEHVELPQQIIGSSEQTRYYSATTGLLVHETWAGATALPEDSALDVDLYERIPAGGPADQLSAPMPVGTDVIPGPGCDR